ncbi:hypothetical protein H9660_11980 [Clostridium sp. Sa3CUN1]|uniref:DUF6906 domain-containing protein n=1 Tax=Clostridium gallinarum TaxID=2762246 RepID=A0ABR8Q613_9CLOT|nr:hypothetical protein [Clostridium gallinarum]MBD7915863.1 hypothetical protein [Clostridium gallinarum]
MKGKNPTRKQKILIKEYKLNPENWLVLKVLRDEETLKNILLIQHKTSKNTKKLEF